MLKDDGSFDEPAWDEYECVLRKFFLYYLASTSFYCYLLATTTECYDCTTTSKYDMFQTEIFQFTSFIHFVWKHTQIKRIDSYYTNNSVFL